MFDNMRIMLLPNQEMEPKPSKGDDKSLLGMKGFVDEMLAFGVLFVLLGKEISKRVKDFVDVFPKEWLGDRSYLFWETFSIKFTWC